MEELSLLKTDRRGFLKGGAGAAAAFAWSTTPSFS